MDKLELLEQIVPAEEVRAQMARNQEAAAFDVADHLNSDAMLIAYLTDFISEDFPEDNPMLLRAAIETAVRALAKRGNP